jgi:hypothetical protein
MSRSVRRASKGGARRSGDPRKRGGQVPARARRAKRRLVAAGLTAAAVVAAVTFIGLRGSAETGADEQTQPGLDHAEAACSLMSKADDAADLGSGVDRDARYAATVLLLDQAMVESARAARANPDFGNLDTSMQAVHTAAHGGVKPEYEAAVQAAEAACRG